MSSAHLVYGGQFFVPEGSGITQVSLYGINGQFLREITGLEYGFVHDLPNAPYVLVARDGSGKRLSGKRIVVAR